MLLSALVFASSTYVLSERVLTDIPCAQAESMIRRAFVQGVDEDTLLLHWSVDCEPAGEVAAQVFVEARGDETVLADYLAARTNVELFGRPFVLAPAASLEQAVTFDAGLLVSPSPWTLETVRADTYRATYPDYATYRQFYSRMLDAMWWSSPQAFAAYLGGLFGGESFAADYLRETMPAIDMVQTRAKLTWKMEDGREIVSARSYDVLRDCRVRENGRCS